MNKIVISISKGVVDSVHSNNPDIEVELWDWDIIESNLFQIAGIKAEELGEIDAKYGELIDEKKAKFKELLKTLQEISFEISLY